MYFSHETCISPVRQRHDRERQREGEGEVNKQTEIINYQILFRLHDFLLKSSDGGMQQLHQIKIGFGPH